MGGIVRSSFYVLALAAAAAAGGQGALADDGSSGLGNQKISDANAKIVAAPSPADAPIPVGFFLAPGVTLLPTAFTELGYDTNPDQSTNPKASAFSRTGAGLALSSVNKDLVANVSAAGSWEDYFSDPYRPSRFTGSTQAAATYLLQPSWTVSGSASYDYDGQSVNISQTGGGLLETAYHDNTLSTFLRLRYTDVRYLNDLYSVSPTTPLLLGPEFNSNRSELTWAGMYGYNSFVAPYAQVFGARVDYTNQPDPLLLDRSAGDYSAKGGVRVTLSPMFYTDLGWRANVRNFDRAQFGQYSSNDFDGAFTWRPSPYFFAQASYSRSIGEPTIDPAVASDIRSYEVKMTYIPVVGVTLSLGAVWQNVNEIWTGGSYDSDVLTAGFAYDYSNHLQFYTTLRYEYYNYDLHAEEYDRFRILAGIRVIPDGNQVLPLDAAGGYKDFVPGGVAHLPNDATVTASLGYSWFDLPSVQMVTKVGGPFFDEAVGRFTNDDGSIGGARADLRLDNFAQHQFDGTTVSFGLSGFYSHFDGNENSHCMYSLTQDCAFVNIVDASPTQENNTGPFGNLYISTYRQVDYYGIGVDARLADFIGGYKDAPTAWVSPFRVGFSFLGLDEETKVTGFDPLVCAPTKYNEWLNTQYYGAYLGVDQSFPLYDGWLFKVNGTAGLYYAQTQYRGVYSSYAPDYGVGYVTDAGAAAGATDKTTFVGTVKVGVNRDYGPMSVGMFGQADYLGYAPKVVYNNNDYAGGAPFGIEGNTYTHIGSGDALNYTAGVSLTFRLNDVR
jgi:hypothetical protein